MKRNNSPLLPLLLCAAMAAPRAGAQNPVVQTCYTGDPAPLVHGGRFYLYVGHDEDNADFFWMQEWRVYSSEDMVNWTDHGSPLALETFRWADDRAWAGQCVERDGKFYWYICAHSALSGGMAIGVAVADSPTGPFRDAIGRPLYDDGKWEHIDPTVFIDDDGQAYICWGNPRLLWARLNRDMVSLAAPPAAIEQTVEGFGAPDAALRDKDTRYADCYTEGPWLTKRGGKYQLLYAAGGIPEHIAYSEADTPAGPWRYKGTVMPQSDTGSFTNHCGVADFKGQSYFVYHTGKLPGGGGFGRSVAIERFDYLPDGRFPTILPTREGVKPAGTLDPYRRVEAETMAHSRGVKTDWNDRTGVFVTDIHRDDYIKLQAVDFGPSAPRSIALRAACALRGGQVEVRLDSAGGPLVATVAVPHTGGWERWRTVRAELTQPATGVRDLFLVFRGRKGVRLMNLDWWQFRR